MRIHIRSISQSLALIFLAVFIILLLLSGKGDAGEKITIGDVEDVVLMPWGVRLPARIDTGAATSSLDARDLKVKNSVAEFKLPEKYGSLQLHLPVIGWRNIRSADFKAHILNDLTLAKAMCSTGKR